MKQKTNKFTPPCLALILAVFLSFLAAGAWQNSAQAMQLIMFEQDHCEWCEVWNKEIGPVYGKTTEGKAAPLRRVDIFNPRPTDLKKIKDPRFTPTFVLFDQGKELGRIRGYPGEDFFWGMLAELLKRAAKSDSKKTTSTKNTALPVSRNPS